MPKYGSYESFTISPSEILVSRDDKLFRSTNNGKNWDLLNFTIKKDSVLTNCLVCIGNNILAGVENVGILRSSDNGLTWNISSNGLFPVLGNLYSFNDILYSTSDAGLFRSIDHGKKWEHLIGFFFLERDDEQHRDGP